METLKKYSRQIALDGFGEIGQKNLREAKVVLIGAGGVGSAALPPIVGAGIGRLTIIDCDVVSESNLHRQTVYSLADIGKFKSECAAEKMRVLNCDVKIDSINDRLQKDNFEDFLSLFKTFDIAIDATDSFGARTIVSDLCAAANLPQIMASAQGYVAQNICFGENFRFKDMLADSCEASFEAARGLPIFAPAAHLSGVFAASKVLLALVSNFENYQVGSFESFDLLSGKFFKTKLK